MHTTEIDNVCRVIDARTLAWSMPIDAPPARIWQALTDPAELEIWFMPAEVDLRVGGEVWYHPEAPFGGTISRLEPERCLEIAQEGDGFLRFEIGDGTVTFTDRMRRGGNTTDPDNPDTHSAGVAAGWHSFLDGLNALVAGGPPTSMEAYQAMIPGYAAWLEARLKDAPAP